MDRWFESHGAQLFTVDAGSGTPIVLLHGGLANHMAVAPYARPLSEKFRVVTPDVRANGKSAFAGDLTWELLADDVAALVHSLGVQRAVIGGVSGGAAVAVATALRHPEVVQALLVVMPAYGGAELGVSPMQQTAFAAMDAAGSRAPAEGVEVMLPLFEALPEPIRSKAREIVAGFDAKSVAATTKFLASLVQPFARGEDLAAIKAPTLVIPGVDPMHPREVADVYGKHVPGVVVRDAAPPDYATVIADFVQSA